MEITFSHPHIEVSQKLQQIANEKLANLKDNYDAISSIEIMLDEQKHLKIAKANIHIPGKIFHAESESTADFLNAIDILVDKLDQQLRKHKEKSTSHRHHE